MPQVLKVFLVGVFVCLAGKCPHIRDKIGFVVSRVSNAVLDAKELSVAGERIRHSLDFAEVLQDFD